jgi:hypothetical protein
VRFGSTELVDAERRVVGVGDWGLAARELGLEELPAVSLPDLSTPSCGAADLRSTALPTIPYGTARVEPQIDLEVALRS